VWLCIGLADPLLTMAVFPPAWEQLVAADVLREAKEK
jgi:hypothetical protein